MSWLDYEMAKRHADEKVAALESLVADLEAKLVVTSAGLEELRQEFESFRASLTKNGL